MTLRVLAFLHPGIKLRLCTPVCLDVAWQIELSQTQHIQPGTPLCIAIPPCLEQTRSARTQPSRRETRALCMGGAHRARLAGLPQHQHVGREHHRVVHQEPGVAVEQRRQRHKLAPACTARQIGLVYTDRFTEEGNRAERSPLQHQRPRYRMRALPCMLSRPSATAQAKHLPLLTRAPAQSMLYCSSCRDTVP